VIDRTYRPIGGQMAGYRKLVIGQTVDQILPRHHRVDAEELEHNLLA
jgi:hypothetical protein